VAAGHPVAGRTYGVIKKYSDDGAGTLVVALGWYRFTAIYPLLLVIVTVFGYVGASSLGTGVINELHQFPVVGAQFDPGNGSSSLHGSLFGLIIGVVGLLYGSLGVTRTAQQVMGRVWNVPRVKMPGFIPKLGRSILGLVVIGSAFAVTATASSLADSSGRSWALRIPVIVTLVAVNTGFYYLAFNVLTPREADNGVAPPGSGRGRRGVHLPDDDRDGTRPAPAAAHHRYLRSPGFGHRRRRLPPAPGQAQCVRRRAQPRPSSQAVAASAADRTTDADNQVLHDLAHEQRRRRDEHVGVGFGAQSPREVELDARQSADDAREPEVDDRTAST
jgi:hypothetical protein